METTIESVGASLEPENSNLPQDSSSYEESKVGLGTDKPKSTSVGVGSKFFKK